MAKYIMAELPDLRGEGKRIKYPKIQITQRISLQELARKISAASSFTEGDVLGLVALLSDEVAGKVAEGYSVKVDGLGTFTAKLAIRRGAEPEEEGGTKRNAASIEIGGINFRADKVLVRQANAHCDLSRTQAPDRGAIVEDESERLDLALAYLRKHSALNIRTYATMTGLERTAAGRELRAFRQTGLLGSIGWGTHLLYTLPQEEQ
ncbi:MAG: DNA-binding protein [Porphyromonadaceae bacterium]|nr:DNA-binding protein [Porphyromonadaceae bacterium]